MNPTPIMRAAAVDEVRLGLRMAFWRARRPVTPSDGPRDHPSRLLTGPATPGRARPHPRRSPKAPTPTMGRSGCRWLPNSPGTARPGRRGRAAAGQQAAPASGRQSTSTWRMAAMGGHAAARRAGESAATSVTTTPTTRELITVVADDDRSGGRDAQAGRGAGLQPDGQTHADDDAEHRDHTPTANASPITEPSTWARLAPMARSSADLAGPLGHDDREGVVDDERADEQGDTANTSRKVLKRACWIWSWVSLVAAAPVMAWVWAGRRREMARTSCSWATPGRPCTRMPENLPGWPSSRAAVA